MLVKSEDQEDLLLSSLYVTGLAAKKSSGVTGEKALVGSGDGVITLWVKGQWDDQDERIIVSREKETVDTMTLVPEGMGGFAKQAAVGLGDGKIRFVQLGQNRIVGEMQHDEVEGVVDVAFDVGGRMISGGGQVVKVWEHMDAAGSDEDESAGTATKRDAASDDDDEDDGEEDADSSEEEEQPRKRRKKRKRGKGPASGSAFSFAGLD